MLIVLSLEFPLVSFVVDLDLDIFLHALNSFYVFHILQRINDVNRLMNGSNLLKVLFSVS